MWSTTGAGAAKNRAFSGVIRAPPASVTTRNVPAATGIKLNAMRLRGNSQSRFRLLKGRVAPRRTDHPHFAPLRAGLEGLRAGGFSAVRWSDASERSHHGRHLDQIIVADRFGVRFAQCPGDRHAKIFELFTPSHQGLRGPRHGRMPAGGGSVVSRFLPKKTIGQEPLEHLGSRHARPAELPMCAALTGSAAL